MASKKRFSYKAKLFSVVNVFFWILVFVFVSIQYSREREYKVELLDTRLQVYNNILLNEYAETGQLTNDAVNRLIPNKNIRVTLLDTKGNVLFESHNSSKIANHLNRPEIKNAIEHGHGYTIRRLSQVKDHEFFYSASARGNAIVRTALPYNVELSAVLSSDMAYIWIVLGATLIVNIILYFAISRISLGVKALHDIANRARNGKIEDFNTDELSDDELGDAARSIFAIYKELQDRTAERDRSMQEALFEEKEKMRIKHQLTSNINHELKTPVQSIRGCFETLLDNELPKETERHLMESGYQSAMRLSNLLEDVTLITRISDAKATLPICPVNVKDVIDGICEEVAQYKPENRMRIHVDVANNVAVEGNRQLIDAIFRNLINNAIAYSGGRDIYISAIEENSGYYKFDFYDNGSGIEAKHLDKIFERFYRIDTGRSRKSGGTGLGLSIVRNAVMFHSGEITARNHKYAGLEFLFTLKKTQNRIQ